MTYRYIQASIDLKSLNDININARREATWSSDTPNDKDVTIKVKVDGTQTEKNETYPVTWEFDWPDNDLKPLEDALSEIHNYVQGRQPHVTFPREVYIDLYPWLRLGWVDENQTWYGYLEFRKENQIMNARFPDWPAMAEFRSIIYRAVNR